MAGRGTRATATDFNNIQSTVSSVMGLGSGQTGYGQAVASSPVAAGSVISTTQWTNIRSDMSKARQHQTNVAVVELLLELLTATCALQSLKEQPQQLYLLT